MKSNLFTKLISLMLSFVLVFQVTTVAAFSDEVYLEDRQVEIAESVDEEKTITQAEETPAEEPKSETEETPAEETKTETEETPVEETKTETEKTPVEETKTETEETPAEEPQAETEETPAEETKSETEETPTEETKTETEKAPVEETKTETEQAPAEEPQTETEQAPSEEPQTETEQAPVEEPKSETEETQTEEPQAETEETQTEEPQAETEQTQTEEPQVETEQAPTDEPQVETEQAPTDETQVETEQVPTDEPQAETESTDNSIPMTKVEDIAVKAEPKIESIEPLAEEVLYQNVGVGAILEDLNLPSALIAKMGEEVIKLNVLEWVADSEFDTSAEGAYAFTPVLSEEDTLKLSETVELPVISVIVENIVVEFTYTSDVQTVDLLNGFHYDGNYYGDSIPNMMSMFALPSSSSPTYGALLSGLAKNIYNSLVTSANSLTVGNDLQATCTLNTEIKLTVTKNSEWSVDSTPENNSKKENLAREIGAAVSAFLMDYPEHFGLSKRYGHNYPMSISSSDGNKGTATITKITVTIEKHTDSIGTSISDDASAIESKINEIFSSSEYKACKTNADKVRYFNKWITSNNKYNSAVRKDINAQVNSNLPWSIQSSFLSNSNKKTDTEEKGLGPVCEAYAKAMKLLCEKANIPCILVSGQGHMWNYVKLDGKWYGQDSTWSDATFGDENNGNTIPSKYEPLTPDDVVTNNDSDGIYDWILEGKTEFEEKNVHQAEGSLPTGVVLSTENYKPTAPKVTVSGTNIFAKNTPIVIEAGKSGSKIRYGDDQYVMFGDSKEADLSKYTIYGGANIGDKGTASIIVKGGTVKEVNASTLFVTGGTVKTDNAKNSYVKSGDNITVKGSVVIDSYIASVIGSGSPVGTITVNDGEILTIPSNASLEINGAKLVNKGTIDNKGSLIINGQFDNTSGKLETTKTGTIGSGTITSGSAGIVITDYTKEDIENQLNKGFEFPYTGSKVEPYGNSLTLTTNVLDKKVDTIFHVSYPTESTNFGIYKAHFTNSNYTSGFDVDYEIYKVTTDLGTPTSAPVTYGEKLEVIVTPKFTTNKDNTAKAMLAATPTAQTANTVALYYGDEKISTEYSVTSGTPVTLTYNTADKKIPAGTNNLTVKFVGDTNRGNQTATVSVTINPKSITLTQGTVKDKTYDGNTTAEVSTQPTINSGILNSDDVKVDNSKAQVIFDKADVGTGKKVTATGYALTGADAKYYELSAQPTFANASITKATPKLTIKNTFKGKEYDGTAIANPTASDMTIEGTTYNDVQFRYYNLDGKLLTVAPKAAGTYKVEAYVTATTNYTAATSDKFEFIITKLTPTFTVTSDLAQQIGGRDVVITVVANIPDTAEEFAVENLILEYVQDVTVVSGKELKKVEKNKYEVTCKLPLYDSNTPDRVATVSITSKDTANYAPQNEKSSVDIKIVDRYDVTLELKADKTEYVYGDVVTLTATATANNEKVAGKFTITVDEKEVPNTDGVVTLNNQTATTHNVKVNFVPKDGSTYKKPSDIKGTFTVKKADPTVTVPSFTATYGQKLSDISFATVENGAWAWNDSTQAVGDVGENKFNAKFTPNDTANYNVLERDISVTVNKATLTGDVKITGTVEYKGTLTADVSNVKGVNSEKPTFTYQWYRNKEIIPNATSSTYTITRVDIGKNIKVRISNPNYADKESSEVAPGKADPIANIPTGLKATYGDKLDTVKLTNASGNTEGIWKWETGGVSVGNVGTNTFDIIFTPKDDGYNTVKTTATVEVAKATATLTVNLDKLTGVDTREATMTAELSKVGMGNLPTGTVVFKNGDTVLDTVTLVDGKATYTWTGLAQGKYTVTVTYSGDTNYSEKTFDYALDTNKKAQEGFKLNAVAEKTYGDAEFELGTVGGNGVGAVTYTSSDGSVIKVEGNKATVIGVGDATITAKKAADNDYNEATDTITIKVNKKAVTVKAKEIKIYNNESKPELKVADHTEITGVLDKDLAAFKENLQIAYQNGDILADTNIVVSEKTVSANYVVSFVNAKFTVLTPKEVPAPAEKVDETMNAPSVGIPKKVKITDNNGTEVATENTKLVVYEDVSTNNKTTVDEKINNITDTAKKEILNSANKVHYEIKLVNKNDDKELTVSGDIDLFIPYPQNTNSSFDFVLMHLKSGNTAEYPTLTKTSYGLTFKVSSFSPFVLGWKSPAPTPAPSMPEEKEDIRFTNARAILKELRDAEDGEIVKTKISDDLVITYDIINELNHTNKRLIVEYKGKSYEIKPSVIAKIPGLYAFYTMDTYVKYATEYKETASKLPVDNTPVYKPENKVEDTSAKKDDVTKTEETKKEDTKKDKTEDKKQDTEEKTETKEETKPESSKPENSKSEQTQTQQNSNTKASNIGIIIAIIIAVIAVVGIVVVLMLSKKK